ncbi:thiamine-phosphate kinase [Methanogenium sp. MK-MG]|uniref:thiamine-phosphate kinase n=1 Tax=Methanogenium sp. MK-MG TaxID=2599926 RepID=UPI0013EC86DB|nr:thiamine-phosphate kinase [Methanogenium sp. MK-MG]KAF1078341.1 Thiamine-monophosphate kinase [Methanogenium sp. MK-MG]
MDDRALVKAIRAIIGTAATDDDCAVIDDGDNYLVMSTDMLHETTDFPAGMTDFECGWMAAAVTLSDVASMGALPIALLLAAGVDRADRVEEIIRGADECCRAYGCRLMGGDMDAHTECTLVSTGLGRVSPACLVRRRGAQPGDIVAVTGVPGRAQAGLDGYVEHWKALVVPRPGVFEGQALGRAGATSMMDVSDGLSISLHDLAEASGVRLDVREAVIPRPEGVPAEDAARYALFGGGDFGLLFTCPAAVFPVAGVDAICIGRVVTGAGVFLDGVALEKAGYSHYWE